MDQPASPSISFKRRRHRRVDSTTSTCAVCGDKSSCYNFGVYACEGCKAFFRRHMNRIGLLNCTKDGRCDVSKDTRKHCTACRMQKCIEVGMRRDPLTKDFVPRRRKSIKSQSSHTETSTPKLISSPAQTHTQESTPASTLTTMPTSASTSLTGTSAAASAAASVASSIAVLNCAFPTGSLLGSDYISNQLSGYSLPSGYSTPTGQSTVTPVQLNIQPSFFNPNQQSDSFAQAALDGTSYLASLYAMPLRIPVTDATSAVRNKCSTATEDLILDANDDSSLSNEIFEEIKQDCLNLAATQRAPWKRSELGETLFNDPHTTDARFQAKFIELGLIRAIYWLKSARCFSAFNNEERIALLKASLFQAGGALWGFTAQTRLSASMVIEDIEDGRIIVKDLHFLTNVFESAGVDAKFGLTQIFGFNDIIKRAFPTEWPIILSITGILSFFPKSTGLARPAEVDRPQFGSTAAAYLSAAFEQKVAAVHREHATFLRRLLRMICERDIQNGVASYFTEPDCASRVEAAWRFCAERYTDFFNFGKTMQDLATAYFSRPLELSTQITPILHEVQQTAERAFKT